MGRRFALVYVLVLAMLVGSTAVASAAPKTGCPAGDWAESSVEVAATTIYGELVDSGPFGTLAEFIALIDAVYDRNDDDSVCVKTMWGEDLNPKSHWYGISLFIVRDNNSNGSNN